MNQKKHRWIRHCTSFQLISGFFHVNQGVLCSEHAEQASSRGVLEGGGGAEQASSNRLAK